MNEWNPLERELRDGRRVTLRVCTPEDLPGVHDLDVEVVRDGRGVIRTVEEAADRERYVARHTPRTRELTGAEKGLFLVAVDESERVVGDGSIKRAPMGLCTHASAIDVAVRPDAQGIGLGRALMEALLSWARAADPPIERVGLFTLADNDRAIALYESLGFQLEGRRRKFVRRLDGTYVDDIVMGLLL